MNNDFVFVIRLIACDFLLLLFCVQIEEDSAEKEDQTRQGREREGGARREWLVLDIMLSSILRENIQIPLLITEGGEKKQ